jgi:hypothetical protein
MRLMPGESRLFSAESQDWLEPVDFVRREANALVVTGQRVLFEFCVLVFGCRLSFKTEGYYLDDVEFVWAGHSRANAWISVGALLVAVGVALLATAGPTASVLSYALGAILLALGVPTLLAGVYKFLKPGMELHVNVSRRNVGIPDW